MEKDRKCSLKFGQVIRIHHCEQSGILIGKGFTDPNAYFMFTKNLDLDNNYRDSLFQILPRGTFEIHDEYLKSKEVKEVLLQRMNAEAQQYHSSIQGRMNEEIHFGTNVIFKHMDSEKYLFGSYNCSEFSMDAFKLKMSAQLSSHTIFKLCPYQTYQKDGQIIFIEEPLIIMHEKSQCKIDFVEGCIFLDQQINYEDIEMQNDQFRPIIKKPMNKRAEAVIGLNSKSQWQFKLHHDYGLIKPYDRCFFQYTQNQAYLSVESGKIILKQFKEADLIPLEAIWEVQPVSKEQTITESTHQQRNAVQQFVLRHHLSGLVINQQGKLVEYMQMDSEHLTLQAAKAGVEELSYNVYVKIKAEKLELQMIENIAKRSGIRRDSSFSSIDMYYKQLSPEDLDYISYQVGFQEKKSLHGFQIKKISDQNRRDLLLICSSHEILQQFCEVLRLPIKKLELKINDQILGQIQSVIQQLIGYILNCDYKEIDITENLPNGQRQIYLKDLQIVEIIMQIIYFISMKNDLDRIFKHKKSEKEKLRSIYKLSYQLIEKMTKGNPQVKLFISQWLELFLHQAMSIADVQVQNSLSELLDDNYYAINKFITKSSLQRLVQLISQRVPHEKYLRIFSSILICNGKAIINNQISILNMFYINSQQITSGFKFQFKNENNKIYVLCQISEFKWRTLKQFYTDSEVEDQFQTWYYFLAYINLLSDICQNRNKFGKKYVSENFDLAILCSILEDPETMEINAIEPFLKLIHTAYIDCQHYTPIRRIARVREWHTIEQKNDILRTHAEVSLKPENCDLKRVMIFIENQLEEFEFFQVKRKSYNQNLFTILSVLKTTLRLGFWKSISNLQEILPNLFKIMSCSRDISEYELDENWTNSNRDLNQINKEFLHLYNESKTKLTKMNQETIIIMKCKVMACEIIDIIIDMETNVRVSKSTQILKKLINNPSQQINVDVTLQDEYIYDVDYWISIFTNMIRERNIFTKVQSYVMEVLFAELTCFENPNLLQFAVKLLNRIYGQRQELVMNFEKILIVASGFTYTLSVDSRVTRTKLLSLNDRNIFLANLDNQKDFNIFLWRESSNFKESGVIQDLNWLCECLKKGGEVKREDIILKSDWLFPQNQLRQVYTERDYNHKLHQSLIKCQDLHENILIFLESATELGDNELLMRLLHSCYNFLSMLIWNHQDNKVDFINTVPIVLNHIQFNVGSIIFLRELFTNNKVLLFSEYQINKVCEIVIKYCDELDYDIYYKSQLLDFLRVLIIFNNKPIKANQNIIMALLQDRRYKNLMLLFNPDSLFNRFEQLIQSFQEDYSKSLKSLIHINISAELTYIFNYFQLLALLIDDQNEINCGKCKHMHPHHLLLQLYQQSGQCWPLKRYLRAYINKLYYAADDYGGITQQIIEIDIENILSDFRDLTELRMLEIDEEEIELSNPTRYTYLTAYVYLTLEENLITLNTILNRQKFLDDLEDALLQNFAIQKFKLHLELLEMGSMISEVQRLWNFSNFIQNFTQILLLVFRSIFRTFDISLLVIREALHNSIPMKAVTIQTTITRRKYNNSVMVSEQISTEHSIIDPGQLLNDRLADLTEENQDLNDLNDMEQILQSSKIMSKKQQSMINLNGEGRVQIYQNLLIKEKLIDQILNESRGKKQISQIFRQGSPRKTRRYEPGDQNVILNKQHIKLMNTFGQNEKFRKFIDEEFYQVCEQLNKIDEEGMRLYQTSIPVISLKDFIQNIIQLNLNEPEALNEELRIFFLKVLERIITEKNPDNKQLPSIDYWTPEQWSDCKGKIEESQNFLEECGAAELICTILKKPGLETRIKLANQVMIFGIAFLLGGNTKCQNSILLRMQNDQQNVMLENFRQLIKKMSRAVINNFKIHKVKQDIAVFNVITVDNYDHYDNQMMLRTKNYEIDDQKEENIKRSFIMLLNRAFRFMQLLCENNNIQMKDFIRQQIDIDGTPKINSINFIELATSSIRIYFKILNKNLLHVPNFILDFIVEVIQVPCLQNQLTLCKTTFFEDSCYLLQHFSSKENLNQRNLHQIEDQQQLQQIYNKILIAIMSVLEGNDDRIYEDLQNKLEPKFLYEIVNQNLTALRVRKPKDMYRLLEEQTFVYSDEIVKILNVLIIKEKIAAKLINSKWQLDSIQKDTNTEILSILQDKIKKIEIVYQDKTQTILYPAHPLFTFLSDQTKDKIMFTINRETQREKILGLLNHKSAIFNELEYNYKLSQLKIPVTAKSLEILSQVAALFSILVNILMVLSYNMDIINQMAFLVADFWESIAINMLAFCQFTATVTYYVLYLIYRVPLCLKGRESQIVEDEKKPQEDLCESIEYNNSWIYRNGQQFKLLVFPKLRKTYNLLYKYIDQVYYVIMNEDDFLRITVYLLFSLLGTFVKSYFFSLHLFDLFSRLSLLRNVFQAISYNAKQLVVVSMLGVLFIYVFSFTTFDSYVDDIYTQNQPEEHCETLISCMITLVTSGVIGTSMSKWDFVKFFYDTMYFVFFALLFTNIVSGIMIDTFAELRDQRQKIEDDKKNKCFICGIDRVQLEKNSEIFEEHVHDKHYLWNYIFYMYCLTKKDSTEYTGLEYAISEMIDNENISWFPVEMDNISTEIEERLLKLENEIPKQLTNIMTIITRLSEKQV